ncbi:hypothetical protein K491DRAFT_694662 [Lophiostoma macrostomum CBS 122681]|uniref:Uncharacterized protein n=1 Tax=Lophiostoma macrostomum CBS 122681 TaxID=1314788 RepID=A0A6A6T3U7_9PLEO|nr:hypothetical protein K491DRAFT_694662 [Lophiostoma macrostomum CBS 122681]
MAAGQRLIEDLTRWPVLKINDSFPWMPYGKIVLLTCWRIFRSAQFRKDFHAALRSDANTEADEKHKSKKASWTALSTPIWVIATILISVWACTVGFYHAAGDWLWRWEPQENKAIRAIDGYDPYDSDSDDEWDRIWFGWESV